MISNVSGCLVYGCSYAAAAAGAWVHLSESC